MPQHEEITATYLAERTAFENPGERVIVGEVTMQVENGRARRSVIIGPEDDGEPTIGGTYRFYGFWTQYLDRWSGEKIDQFRFQTFVPAEPHTKLGIVQYLKMAPEIGKVLAARLYDTFGDQAAMALREDPDQCASRVQGLSRSAAQAASEWLASRQSIENCMIDVMELLSGRGFPKKAAKEAIKAWGNQAAWVIRRDPHSLMRFRGCGFKLTDTLYLTLGLPPAKMKRQALCAWHGIASNASGDTWFYRDVAAAALKQSIGGATVNDEKAIRLAARAGLLAVRYTAGPNGPLDALDGTCCWLAESRKARNEAMVAKYVAEAMGGTGWDMLIDDLPEISTHQLDKLHAALDPGRCIAILGGSPGTGKTFTAAQLVKRIVGAIGAQHICIAAPTGKAAVRITEAMQQYGVRLKAKTIHSLLGVAKSDAGDGWTFVHDRSNPLPYRFIIVDESSMIDTDLMASLLAARHRDTCVLFVGDVNQLPPVGHGAPLRDFIAAGLPYGELTEIRRNSGMIVEACAAIRDEQPWKVLGRGERDRDDDTQNFVCTGGSNAEEQIAILKKALAMVAKTEGVDRVWDCQVLTAVNAKSKLSRKALNEILQGELNSQPKVGTWPFRLGDKVVCLQNGWYPVDRAWKKHPAFRACGANERGEVYVANGEVGRVLEIRDKENLCVVELDAPARHVVVRRSKGQDGGSGQDGGQDGSREGNAGKDAHSDNGGGKGAVGCWDLAYVLSTHKSQGSEWPVVFVMLDSYPGALRVADRAWFYTAISRAKKLCVLVGEDHVARRYCKTNGISKRKTFLKELIVDALPTQENKADQLHPSATQADSLPPSLHHSGEQADADESEEEESREEGQQQHCGGAP